LHGNSERGHDDLALIDTADGEQRREGSGLGQVPAGFFFRHRREENGAHGAIPSNIMPMAYGGSSGMTFVSN